MVDRSESWQFGTRRDWQADGIEVALGTSLSRDSQSREPSSSLHESRSVPITTDATPGRPDALVVRIEGPNDRSLDAADIARLFPDGSTIAHALRQRRLQTWPRVVASVGGELVALAAFRHVHLEMQVLDFAISLSPRRVARDDSVTMLRVFHAVLDVIELVSTAGGCDRILMYPPRVPTRTLERRGYVLVDEGDAAHGWQRWLSVGGSSRRKSGNCETASG
jgi:hypothetical protein